MDKLNHNMYLLNRSKVRTLSPIHLFFFKVIKATVIGMPEDIEKFIMFLFSQYFSSHLESISY